MKFVVATVTFALALNLLGCSGGSSSSASSSLSSMSASEVAADSVGGALGGSSSSGTVSFFKPLQILWETANATGGACPTIATMAGSGCSANGNNADMVYSGCSFGAAVATWTGAMEMSLSSSAQISCGTFPTPASGVYLQRQFVTILGGSVAPGTVVRSRGANSVTIDNSSNNLSNFNGDTITANIGTGYGAQVKFTTGGNRNGIVVKERIYNGAFDHTINASLVVSESGGVRTIASGAVTVYHNLLRVIGTANFSNVTYTDACPTPTHGTITTNFTAGSVSPTALGALYVGHSETLTFTACGSATLTSVGGAVSSPTSASL